MAHVSRPELRWRFRFSQNLALTGRRSMTGGIPVLSGQPPANRSGSAVCTGMKKVKGGFAFDIRRSNKSHQSNYLPGGAYGLRWLYPSGTTVRVTQRFYPSGEIFNYQIKRMQKLRNPQFKGASHRF